jgi:hypothetical protein
VERDLLLVELCVRCEIVCSATERKRKDVELEVLRFVEVVRSAVLIAGIRYGTRSVILAYSIGRNSYSREWRVDLTSCIELRVSIQSITLA